MTLSAFRRPNLTSACVLPGWNPPPTIEISSPPAVVPCGGSTESTLTGPPFWVHAAMRAQTSNRDRDAEDTFHRVRLRAKGSDHSPRLQIGQGLREVGERLTLLDAFALGHRPAHLAQRLLLELAHALARQAVLVADLLERSLLVVHEPEALAEDVRLDRLERREQPAASRVCVSVEAICRAPPGPRSDRPARR